jgi:hypothetical protein
MSSEPAPLASGRSGESDLNEGAGIAVHFKIIYSNHADLRHLEDYLVLLRMLVESAGHPVDYDYHLCVPHFCHIVVDGFATRHADAMQEIKRYGSESIIVATEYVTSDTFNDFPDAGYEEQHYSDRAYWRSRFQNFRACARHARAIWCASSDPGQIALYQAVVEDVPVVPLPFPHFPAYPRVAHRLDKDIEVFFSGKVTPHRREIMSRVGQGHVTFAAEGFVPDCVRRDAVARSKICLNLKQAPQWQFPSLMRYWYHLSNGSFLLGEQCPIRCELDSYVPSVAAEQLGDVCGELLRSGQGERLAAEAHERFAGEHPGKVAAQELMDRSFSRRPVTPT